MHWKHTLQYLNILKGCYVFFQLGGKSMKSPLGAVQYLFICLGAVTLIQLETYSKKITQEVGSMRACSQGEEGSLWQT